MKQIGIFPYKDLWDWGSSWSAGFPALNQPWLENKMSCLTLEFRLISNIPVCATVFWQSLSIFVAIDKNQHCVFLRPSTLKKPSQGRNLFQVHAHRSNRYLFNNYAIIHSKYCIFLQYGLESCMMHACEANGNKGSLRNWQRTYPDNQIGINFALSENTQLYHSIYAHINDNPLLHTLLFAHRILSQHLTTLFQVPGSFICESRQ